MDPISLIVVALATGAAAALKPTAEAAIRDAYAGLKRLITDRYNQVDVSPVERNPSSQAKRRSLEEDLHETDAAADDALLQEAKELFDLVAKADPAAARGVGVDLEDIDAAFVDIDRVRSGGIGVRGRGWNVTGGVRISNVEAGGDVYQERPQPDPS
ncbi:hypothetical protein E3T55_10880 [Cryobacterium frigoriphilum]|uniref:Uncharacterized protein n=1 Tax=Cryobacterium frigoriphilum TaxID=1259150 RepID=A0A4R8ZZU4_9MICO|nr:hypothetical protein [Cryobacterium frigoriphilum]TFD49576.1 hypothetical protein E3T55_10880 [Cryobacterium frigoriphilum]